MTRITQKDLEAVAARINHITGNPTKSWIMLEDGHCKSQIGNYHISYAYGGAALHQMMNEGGGIRDLFGGHMPKRELYERMHSYILGLSDASRSDA